MTGSPNLVRQGELQARGKVCARFPISCLIRDMLEEAGMLSHGRKIVVLDMTFGEGRFWVAIPEAEVWGFDIVRLKWFKKPFRFYECRCENWAKKVGKLDFDLICVDPPWLPRNHTCKLRKHFGVTTSVGSILREAEKASLHFKRPLLVHFLWRAIPYGFEVLTERWFQPVSRYVNVTRPTWFGLLKPRL